MVHMFSLHDRKRHRNMAVVVALVAISPRDSERVARIPLGLLVRRDLFLIHARTIFYTHDKEV